jgi:putative transposase
MSFWRLYYHLVWSTKNRLPLITPEIEPELINYIMRKATETGACIHAINGFSDHIHQVLAIPPELSIAQYVKLSKGSSSHYVNYTIKPEFTFSWQRGYGVLSMGEKQLQIAMDYVNNQKKHHADQTTISWLERSLEESEGPDHFGLHSTGRTAQLREESGIYSIDSISPF